jgi:hypothetical protein
VKSQWRYTSKQETLVIILSKGYLSDGKNLGKVEVGFKKFNENLP